LFVCLFVFFFLLALCVTCRHYLVLLPLIGMLYFIFRLCCLVFRVLIFLYFPSYLECYFMSHWCCVVYSDCDFLF